MNFKHLICILIVLLHIFMLHACTNQPETTTDTHHSNFTKCLKGSVCDRQIGAVNIDGALYCCPSQFKSPLVHQISGCMFITINNNKFDCKCHVYEDESKKGICGSWCTAGLLTTAAAIICISILCIASYTFRHNEVK